MNGLTAARALGWVSVGIAATEILGQGHIEDELGIDPHPHLLPALDVYYALKVARRLVASAAAPKRIAGAAASSGSPPEDRNASDSKRVRAKPATRGMSA